MAQAFRAVVGRKAEDQWESLLSKIVDGGLHDGDRVLDVGCGVGRASIAVASRARGVRIDAMARTAVEAAHARSQIRREHLDRRVVVRVSTGALPFDDETFEAALSIDSSLPLVDAPDLLAEVFRVLRSGGSLYLRWHSASWLVSTVTDGSVAEASVTALERAGFVVSAVARTCATTSLVRRPPRRRFEPAVVATWELRATKA
ncbi:MAG: class I SAM-dependent methyltransferase [Polyangiaceae bacterium]|nr:class I SAM-dependent methyltransferase [Polyangiaceae bacterium]